MIYTSNKPQAKIVTTNSWHSSTDITNIQKELLGVQVSLLSHYLQLLKKITKRPGELTESLFFFYYKKQQATSRQPAARCLFIFFLFKKATSNKPAASSPVNA